MLSLNVVRAALTTPFRLATQQRALLQQLWPGASAIGQPVAVAACAASHLAAFSTSTAATARGLRTPSLPLSVRQLVAPPAEQRNSCCSKQRSTEQLTMLCQIHDTTTTTSSNSGEVARDAGMPPGSQFLASLVNYEVTGLPPTVQPAASSTGATPAASIAAAAPTTSHQPAPAAVEAGSASGDAYDLARMHQLLAALGNPHHQYPVVHVAGSKGKGSVVALLSCILRAAGYKVGTYSSPHLLQPQERIQGPQEGGAPVSVERWEQLAATVRGAALTASSTSPAVACSTGATATGAASSTGATATGAAMPTYFEAVTAMALHHFAEAGVDVAVVETGMGGRHDATNVFSPKQLLAAVITTLGLEHVAALGGSLKSIAAAKAGIMKEGRPVVVAAQPQPEAAQVLLEHAAALGCSVVHAGEVVKVCAEGSITLDNQPGPSIAHQAINITANESSTNSSTKSSTNSSSNNIADSSTNSSSNAAGQPALQLDGVPCHLVGAHQHSNIQVAVAAASELRQQGWNLPDTAVAAGLQQAWLPGRFQVIHQQGWNYHLVLDGAHTADSAAALAASIRQAFPQQPLVLVVAMAADKEHRDVIAALRSMRPAVAVFTSVPIAGGMQRAAPPGTLAAHWQAAAMLSTDKPFRCRELIQASLGAALQKGRHELGAYGEGVIVVTGSLHAVAAALKALKLAVPAQHAG